MKSTLLLALALAASACTTTSFDYQDTQGRKVHVERTAVYNDPALKAALTKDGATIDEKAGSNAKLVKALMDAGLLTQ